MSAQKNETERKSSRKAKMPRMDATPPSKFVGSKTMVKVSYILDGMTKYAPADHLQFRTSEYTPNEDEEQDGLLEVPDSVLVPEEELEEGMNGYAFWGKDLKYFSAKIEKILKKSDAPSKKNAKRITGPVKG